MVDHNGLSASQLQNQQKLFNAAEQLFERFGYKKTTVIDICKAAGMSKPTFYGLFKDKGELFVALLFEVFGREIKDWKNTQPTNAEPLSCLLAFIEFYENVLVKKPIFRLIVEDPTVMEKFAWVLHHTANSPVLTTLRQILKDGINAGQFRTLDPDAVLWMIYALLDSMYILMPMMTGEPGAGENPDIAREVKSFILSGVGVNNEE
ncbi:MAG: TetR/AcrR family transcriptional regulator [Candidatus Hatepunaea meridiana]|nr:TetR/AcrR family transcriptional regulator [Candidatus Hatepunaea meridiana]